MTDGLMLIDKPAGMTSFGVVARVRRVLSNQQGKKIKVGHCGTLDPFATGLLLLCVGQECKNAGQYMKHDKVYEATFRLGQTSTSGDTEGEIVDVSDHHPSLDDVRHALRNFVGSIEQQPPMYSAIKINGQRAYHIARRGEKIDLPIRTVTIYSLDLIEYAYPDVKVRVHVSSGTYIRSLAVDFGQILKTGAYCLQLRRTKIANFDVSDALRLEDMGITS